MKRYRKTLSDWEADERFRNMDSRIAGAEQSNSSLRYLSESDVRTIQSIKVGDPWLILQDGSVECCIDGYDFKKYIKLLWEDADVFSLQIISNPEYDEHRNPLPHALLVKADLPTFSLTSLFLPHLHLDGCRRILLSNEDGK